MMIIYLLKETKLLLLSIILLINISLIFIKIGIYLIHLIIATKIHFII